MRVSVKAKVRGNVQGVSFRDFAKAEADRVRVAGYVLNCMDGTVDVEAEGEMEALLILLNALQRGPPRARVDEVDFQWGEPNKRFRGFVVRD